MGTHFGPFCDNVDFLYSSALGPAAGGDLPAHTVGHSVQFYDDDSALLDNLAQFIGGALGSGGTCVVIATRAHRDGLSRRLLSFGMDLAPALSAQRYFALDAQDTLNKFMVNNWPDAERFEAAVAPLLQQAQLACYPGAGKTAPPTAAFGEMVALLWDQGKPEAAIRLEELWNELAHRHSFNLRCAYPMRSFSDAAQEARFRQVCDKHTHVLPTESYSLLTDNDQRLRMVTELQQKVQTLQSEIDRRRQSEERLKQAQAAIVQSEKLAAAGRLAATIAHEINNPLEAVTNFIYLAKTHPGVPEEVCKQLEIADREVARVAQIAQQTLGFYRDNTHSRWTKVAPILSDVLAVYDRKLQQKNITVEFSADAALELHVKQGELKQILANLIANAIDASRSGGMLQVRAHAQSHGKAGAARPGVRISIADNGAGMDADVKLHLFDPFFTTKADLGTGIGLWVSKSLIEAQGGFVQFRSRHGERSGTVLSFFLPCEMSAQTAAA